MSENSGIIYDLGEGRYGIARNTRQAKSFIEIGKVFLEVYLDRECTIPERDPKNGKRYVTLKHKTKIKQIGFVD